GAAGVIRVGMRVDNRADGLGRDASEFAQYLLRVIERGVHHDAALGPLDQNGVGNVEADRDVHAVGHFDNLSAKLLRVRPQSLPAVEFLCARGCCYRKQPTQSSGRSEQERMGWWHRPLRGQWRTADDCSSRFVGCNAFDCHQAALVCEMMALSTSPSTRT